MSTLDPAADNAAAKSMRASTFSLIVSGFYVTWVWYIYFAFRVGIPLLIWLITAAWDFVTTLFAAGWAILTSYRFLLFFAVVFVALYFIQRYWPEFVGGLEDYILPALDIIYNVVLRFLWNTLILTILNLLIYVWDACVQLIGFFIYFAVNVIVTIAYLVVEILGEINLGTFIEELMKIITKLVEIVVAVLQLLIKVGVVILNLVKPLLIALLKVWIQYIKILFKIVFWLLVPLFRALFFLLKAIVVVVKFVIGVLLKRRGASRSARSILSFDEPNLKDAFQKGAKSVDQNEELYGQASKLNIFEAMSESMRYYSVGQYMGFVSSMNDVHMGIRQNDPWAPTGRVDNGGWDGGDLEEHLYERDELEEHEKPWHMRETPTTKTKKPMTEMQMAKKQASMSTAGKRRLNELLDGEDIITKLQTIFGPDDDEEEDDEKMLADDIDFEEEEDDSVNEEGKEEEEEEHVNVEVDEEDNVGNHWQSNETIEERHARWRENPEHWWRINVAHNWTSEQVFPHLKGRKLRRAQLHKLFKPHTPEQHLHVRKVALAYGHAIEHAMYRGIKRHIHSGHWDHAIRNTWKHLSGHTELTSWIHEKFGPPGNRKYASTGHWLHSVLPDITNEGLFKMLKDMDPESKTRLYHHDWVRSVCKNCTDGVLPREIYEHLEAQERWNEEQDYLNSGSGQPSSPLPDCDGVTMQGDKYCLYGGKLVRRVTLPTGRKLHISAKFEPFGIDLEFLYVSPLL